MRSEEERIEEESLQQNDGKDRENRKMRMEKKEGSLIC